ncbi:MAG: endonuclease V [candidate division WOR-3 bacterium]|nr:MAG: endonuclease V [candidate division WOR-3 bacterium]
MNKKITLIAGCDVAQNRGFLYASIVLCSFPDMQFLEAHRARKRADMPYIPGFLSYRELPVLERAYRKIRREPAVMLVDGQGIAHPRGLGLASHLGVVLNVPTIGCAKSHLYGRYTMPGLRRGARRHITAAGSKIGLVLRTRDNVKPLFVSPGHRVNLLDCMRIVLAASVKYRIPEPIRWAHITAGHWARYE